MRAEVLPPASAVDAAGTGNRGYGHKGHVFKAQANGRKGSPNDVMGLREVGTGLREVGLGLPVGAAASERLHVGSRLFNNTFIVSDCVYWSIRLF